jgi:hypothetical protein
MRRDIIEDDPIAALNTVVVILGGALDPDQAQEQLVTDRANGEIEQIGVLPGREHDLVGGKAHALKVADCGMRASSENAGNVVCFRVFLQHRRFHSMRCFALLPRTLG